MEPSLVVARYIGFEAVPGRSDQLRVQIQSNRPRPDDPAQREDSRLHEYHNVLVLAGNPVLGSRFSVLGVDEGVDEEWTRQWTMWTETTNIPLTVQSSVHSVVHSFRPLFCPAPPSTVSLQLSSPGLVLHELSVDDDAGDPGGVLERIAVEEDEVGVLSGSQ
jgi:hypothetical protein